MGCSKYVAAVVAHLNAKLKLNSIETKKSTQDAKFIALRNERKQMGRGIHFAAQTNTKS